MPAFFNGIFGHKPTTGYKSFHSSFTNVYNIFWIPGIVSNFEQQPVAETILQTFLVTGPMSRYCCDLLPMYRILAADNLSKLKLDLKVIKGSFN